jgi:hypothetical protein
MAGSNSAVMVGTWSLRVWQMCFLVVGLPGLLLAALVWLTVREPAARKGGGQEAPRPLARRAGLSGARTGDFRAAHAGLCLFGLGPVRDARLGPAALMRGFGLNAQEAGLRLGIVAILAGGGGAFASGWLLDRFARLGRADTTFLVGIAGGWGRRWPAWRWLWPAARPGRSSR